MANFQFSLWDSKCFIDFDSILFINNFQFSLWDSYFMSSSSLYAKSYLSILFMRFSIIACENKAGFTKTFNSLYEIHFPSEPRQLRKPANFQFSLWDSKYSCWRVCRFLSRLSILFMRFPVVTSTLIANGEDPTFNSLYEIQSSYWRNGSWWKTFNSLYEIRYARSTGEYFYAYTFNSLYEILRQISITYENGLFILSILFMRFKDTLYPELPSIVKLSILFMRFKK